MHQQSAEHIRAALGKRIAAAEVGTDGLTLRFADGTGLELFDDGQQCCEQRWMTTDDDLRPFAGAEFRGAEVREGNGYVGAGVDPESDSEFLIVATSLGDFTVVNYNLHNGYYGGFDLVARPL